MLNVASTPAPVVALGGGKYVMVLPDDPLRSIAVSLRF